MNHPPLSLSPSLAGLGIDNVLSYRVVLPDGRLVVANETGEYSDLLW